MHFWSLESITYYFRKATWWIGGCQSPGVSCHFLLSWNWTEYSKQETTYRRTPGNSVYRSREETPPIPGSKREILLLQKKREEREEPTTARRERDKGLLRPRGQELLQGVTHPQPVRGGDLPQVQLQEPLVRQVKQCVSRGTIQQAYIWEGREWMTEAMFTDFTILKLEFYSYNDSLNIDIVVSKLELI